MNRLFLCLFVLMLISSFLHFVWKRNQMERKQQIVIYTMYVLSAIGLYAIQYQHDNLMPTGFFLNILTPRVKMWIDQIL
ncbi:hypothetical protein [Brevibacillus sp. SAFN-007a]|uniref:hypothetical protein n=1 Tax=Brevibacillus sp. SAFN-007a TaxID=3436862 RepID=UPI003F80D9A7